MSDKNLLFYGDNLAVLRQHSKSHLKDDSIDLIYLDPPFNSQANYNLLFEHKSEPEETAQIRAFEDTWRWDDAAASSYQEILLGGGDLADTLKAFHQIVGPSGMLAYLSMMAPRLAELRRVMKPTATIYLHCDPSASHYLKLLLDAVFGAKNFRNEIIWCYAGGGTPRNDFPRKHDVIFRYTKSDKYTYNPIYRPYSAGTISRGRTQVKGKYFTQGLCDKGTPVNDWWVDVPKITSPTDPEKLGYPTQKSEALLRRIIEASSNEGDSVLDPFCGCGTTISVCNQINRRWIGIDITHLAIGLIKHRLSCQFGSTNEKNYITIGEPMDLSGARTLAQEDTHQFEHWALGLVSARSSAKGKGADKGIDGYLPFREGESGSPIVRMLISVKSGKVSSRDIRDLRGVIEREGAPIGLLITLQEPSKDMRTEAASAGFWESRLWGSFRRIQILTISELLSGKSFDCKPAYLQGESMKRAALSKVQAWDGDLEL